MLCIVYVSALWPLHEKVCVKTSYTTAKYLLFNKMCGNNLCQKIDSRRRWGYFNPKLLRDSFISTSPDRVGYWASHSCKGNTNVEKRRSFNS